VKIYFYHLIFLIFFLIINYSIIFHYNLKKLFIKKNLTHRWSNDDCYLIGGYLFGSSIFFIFLLDLFFGISSYLSFDKLIFICFFLFIGFIDDKRKLNGYLKILIFFISIFFINYYYNSNSTDYSFINYFVFSILLFILFVSLNIIDNMNGIFIISFLLICTFFLLNFYLVNALDLIFFIINIIIISFFFLYINFSKKNNYLGDSGSNLLSILILLFFFDFVSNNNINFDMSININNLIIFFSIFSYPLFDLFFVSISRLINKKSPLIGGVDHTSHILTKLTKSEIKSFIIILIIQSIILLSLVSYINNLISFYIHFVISLIIYSITLFLILNFKNQWKIMR